MDHLFSGVPLAKNPQVAAHFSLACVLDQGMFLDAALENLLVECTIRNAPDLAYSQACSAALNNILEIVLDTGFHKSLQQLRAQMPPDGQSQEQLDAWWKVNYSDWLEQLKKAIADYRNIHYHWQFSPEQEQVLQSYYDANQLLIDCLNSNSEITPTIREEIEATLLLPQRELEEREWK